ncbi:MAG: serine/threonine protein kinase [Planctomycetes bacterium]|nr:serine/threonine protein kinase [Planctomycetota bacterium]
MTGKEAKVGPDDERFAALALRERVVTDEQVRECSLIQGKLHAMGIVGKSLGEVLREKGYLTVGEEARIHAALLQGEASPPPATGVATGPRAQAAAAPAPTGACGPAIPGYEVLERIGQGGMGVVYRARQLSMDREVALKVLAPRLAQDPAYVERFLGEARAVARLNHENMVAGIDVGEAGGHYYFAMELVEGRTVARAIEEEGRLAPAEAARIALQVARALEHAAHHAVVHRDVKPQNIIVTPQGVAKLMDLGLARVEGEEHTSSNPGVSIGTPHYISPEQARGERQVDTRSDLYSLGASLYHMVTGRTPFEGDSAMVVMTKHMTEAPRDPRRLEPSVPAPLSRLILQCMAKAREERPASAEALAAELERLLRAAAPARGRETARTAPGAPARSPSGTALAAPPRTGSTAGLRAAAARRRGGDPLALALVLAGAVVVALAAFWHYFTGRAAGERMGTSEEDARQADEAMEGAVRYQREHPLDRAGIRQRYLSIVERYPGTRAAFSAREALAAVAGGG